VKRRPPTSSDRKALQRAARSERAARERWDETLAELQQAIEQASRNGASLREIAATIGRSHGRVRDLLQR
jgi:DNA-binding NarL/FixJ family response regulator